MKLEKDFQSKNNASKGDMKYAYTSYKAKKEDISKHRHVAYQNNCIEILRKFLKKGFKKYWFSLK